MWLVVVEVVINMSKICKNLRKEKMEKGIIFVDSGDKKNSCKKIAVKTAIIEKFCLWIKTYFLLKIRGLFCESS